MKLRFLLFVCAVFFALNFSVRCQEKSNLQLIDNLRHENCDAYMMRLNGFLQDIPRGGLAIGYVVVHGNKNNPVERWYYDYTVTNYHRGYRPNDLNWSVIHGEDENELRFEFWLRRNGTKPNVKEVDWSYGVPGNGENFQVAGAGYNIKYVKGKAAILDREDGDCSLLSSDTSLKLFADYLVNNPGYAGRIVIYNNSRKNVNKIVGFLMKRLSEEGNIEPDRIRYIQRPVTGFPQQEFWLVPTS
jgi:hypothetical protein